MDDEIDDSALPQLHCPFPSEYWEITHVPARGIWEVCSCFNSICYTGGLCRLSMGGPGCLSHHRWQVAPSTFQGSDLSCVLQGLTPMGTPPGPAMGLGSRETCLRHSALCSYPLSTLAWPCASKHHVYLQFHLRSSWISQFGLGENEEPGFLLLPSTSLRCDNETGPANPSIHFTAFNSSDVITPKNDFIALNTSNSNCICYSIICPAKVGQMFLYGLFFSGCLIANPFI